jgi:hypothetical protein
MTMPHRRAASTGLEGSAPGLGCLSMSDFYGPEDEVEVSR